MGIVVAALTFVAVIVFLGIVGGLLFAVLGNVQSPRESRAQAAAIGEFRVEVRRRVLMGVAENRAEADVKAETIAFYAAGGSLERSGMHLSNGRTRYSRPYDPTIVTSWPTKGGADTWAADWYKPAVMPGIAPTADPQGRPTLQWDD